MSDKADANVYHINKIVVWAGALLGVVCLVLAIALPLSLKDENITWREQEHTYLEIQPHDPFSVDPFDYYSVSAAARTAFSQLTEEQIYGQLQMLDLNENQPGGLGQDDTLYQISRGVIGSLLNLDQIRAVNDDLQNQLLRYNPVPMIYGNDTIHGYATSLPQNIAMAAAWSPELIEKGSAMAARETLNTGIKWTFGPNLDVARDPRWGRFSECSGEDPYLSGKLGAAYIRGFQSEGLAACPKHITGYGMPKGGRDYAAADLDLAVLFNDYTKSFEIAIKEGKPWTIMASYNSIDGVPAHSNRFLFNDVIRGHWGWEGFIIADYIGVEDLVTHWRAEDEYEAVKLGIYTGIDMSMSDGYYLKYLPKVGNERAPDGRTYYEHASMSARRIVAVKDKVKLFEDKDFPPFNDPEYQYCSDANLAIALETSEKSHVLLTNKDNTLPINISAERPKILLVGSLAHSRDDQVGSWPAQGQSMCPEKLITYKTALEDTNDEYDLDFQVGYTHPIWPDYYTNRVTATNKPNFVDYPPFFGEMDPHVNRENFKNAVRTGDYTHIVFIVGDHQWQNGETSSRTNLTLSGWQQDVMRDAREIVDALPVTARRPKLIGALMTARPMIVEWEQENLDALIYTWVSGHMGGPAFKNILFGNTEVNGKLPFTIPRNEGQIPLWYSQMNSTRDIWYNWDGQSEVEQPWYGQFNAVSRYIDSVSTPRFVFGYGLSYSTFTYGTPTISHRSLPYGSTEPLTVTVTITRSGSTRPTAEIVQLYIRDMLRTYVPPNKQLRGFERVEFGANENQKTVTFTLDLTEDFGFYTPTLEWIVEPGDFKIFVASHSADESHALDFTITDP